uniref:CAP-Gly domain-containing protein n=1 Tax=Oryza meridionalis TaxID=40149 RepID=A0A0E0DKU7_9ORYZ
MAAVAFRLGQRVHAAGDHARVGTVRYLGPVDGHPGDWLGVDWDAGAGGRHDGSLAGRRYFVAAGERSASFARPTALSAGITLPDAIRNRYRVEEFTKEEQDEMYVFSTSQKRVSVELVGKNKVEEKLKNLNDLTSASVSYMGVSSIGPGDELKNLVPNLRQLDLTGNLLSQWQDIFSLCEALASLEILDLTNNTMENDFTDSSSVKNIRVLVLNYCGVTWELVEKIKVSFSCLSELHLMTNRIKAMMTPVGNIVQGFDTLRLLNLEDNHIDSWDEIVKLSYLRSLEQLHLNKNMLKHVTYPSNPPPLGSLGDAAVLPFEKLRVLLLGSNQIDEVLSVDSLNLFPSLTLWLRTPILISTFLKDVRLSDNPVADPAKGGVPRFVLIARLGKVKILNGSEISPRERREAEIRYVRLVMGKAESYDPEEIKRLHPRFAELKAFHGIEDEKPSSRTSGPQKMASGLISITLKCVGPSMGEKQSLTKKLPPATTVGKLKSLCESFFKLKDVKLRLYLEEEGCPLPQFFEEDTVSLMELGIGTGSTIIVDEES